ncbi:MAG: hypothetical protein IJ268_05110, partial [Proteobacteria bacterium]|nr:hypothetical protein [Pseudomonadota bacterium]
MRHREKIFLSGQRRCTVPLLALALLAVTGIGGCSWDSGLYDELVGTDGTQKDVVEPCGSEKDPLKYIKYENDESSGWQEREKCLKDESCNYQNSFAYNICPANLLCNQGRINGSNELSHYCYPKCDKGLISCDGTCINPERDLDGYCGARGACISEDPESEDYKGRLCP